MQLLDEKVFTVTAITRAIKYVLEESFPSVWVEGEISNYLHHTSGHRYFSLKDENAAIKVTIWRSAGQYLKFEPKDGIKVRVFGDITVYEKGGNYQLNARKVQPVGIGELEIAFRQLYERLAAEGLFEPSHKKLLPTYPVKIGLVTSPTGAAIRDIMQIARRRNSFIQLVLYPAQVQGDGAAEAIIEGIRFFNNRIDIDLIIIARGGGSLEDLWAFNEEPVVRAIAASGKPTVTGIGHEIDTTLADLAADLRAATPSAAAELVIWEKETLRRELAAAGLQLASYLQAIIERDKYRLNQLRRRPVYLKPEEIIREREQYLDNLKRQFVIAGKIVLEKQKNTLSLSLSRLESLSPLAVLARGYAVIRDLPSGKTVKSVADLKRDSLVEARLKDGSAVAQVKEVRTAEQKE